MVISFANGTCVCTYVEVEASTVERYLDDGLSTLDLAALSKAMKPRHEGQTAEAVKDHAAKKMFLVVEWPMHDETRTIGITKELCVDLLQELYAKCAQLLADRARAVEQFKSLS
jgi:hypothetical protein